MAVIMALGCASSAFAAYDGITYTARGVSENLSSDECISVVVDLIDEVLKDAGIRLDVGQALQSNLEPWQMTSLNLVSAGAGLIGLNTMEKVLGLVVDLTSVDGLLKAVDDFKSILYYTSGSENAIWATLKPWLGDLKELNLRNWVSGRSRAVSGDKTVFNSLISLIKDNGAILVSIVSNRFSTGVLGFGSSDFLGADGIRGLLKDVLVELVYSDKNSEQYKAAVEKPLDEILYEIVIPNLLGGEDDYLPGFTLSAETSIDSLIDNIWNICWDKYMADGLKKINVPYDESNALAMSFSQVIKLDFYNEATGESSFDTNFTVDTSKPFLAQANGLLEFLARQFIQPAYRGGLTWKTDASGGYSLIGENIKNLFVYILKCADFSGTKYASQAQAVLGVANPDFNSVILLTMKVILAEFAGNYNTAEVQACDDIYDMAFILLKELVTGELGINASYSGDDDYLDVCADILAYYVGMITPLLDYDGRPYKAGGGAELDDVVNYIANYYQYTRGFQKAFNLPAYALRSEPYKKADALIGLIFSDATSQQDRFDLELMLIGKNGSKGLFDSILTIDIQNIFDITVSKFLNYINGIDGMTATKMIYSLVKNLLDNMFDKKIIADYATANPFDNMLSAENLGVTVTNLISSIDSNKNNLVPCVCYLVSLFVPVKKGFSVVIAPAQYEGQPVTPSPVVKFDSKTLVNGVDYTVSYSNNNSVGIGKVVITGKGNYEGEYEAPFTILGADISKAAATLSTDMYNYTGGAVTPSVSVSYLGAPLSEGVDYTVSYENNINPGAAAAVITGMGKYSGTLSKTYYIKPTAAVTNITAVSAGSTVSLTWDTVPGATGYRVFYVSTSKYVTVTQNSAKISGLSANTAYSIRIRPYTRAADGKLLWGNYSAITAARTGPASSVVTVSSVTASSVKVSWSPVSGVYRYQLDKYDYSTRRWTRCTTTTATSYNATGLASNGAYAFRVRAYSYVGGVVYYGDYSANRATRTLPATCTNVRVSGRGGNWVTLTWDEVPGARYNVYTYNASTKKWAAAATVSANTATIRNLSPLKTYQYRVRAYVTSGGVNYVGAFSSTVSATTTFTKVAALSASSVRTTTTIGLKWTAVSGAASYQIYRYDAASKTYKYYALSKTNSYVARNLTAGTTYYFKVRAVKAVNGKNYYGEFSNFVKLATCPAQVTGLKQAGNTSTSVSLTWNAVRGATAYEVYRKDSSGSFIRLGATSSNSCKISNLSRSSSYQFRVRAVVTVGSTVSYGAYSAVVTAQTNRF